MAKPSTALAPRELNKYLLERTDQLAEWCKPNGLDPQSLRRLAVRDSMNPESKLGQCDPRSIYLALCDAAQLGLEPSGLGGDAYLVPFWDKKANSYLATLMPGWQGLAKLARRSGSVIGIWSYVVREGDEFDVQLGTEPRVMHKPRSSSGEVIAAYAVAEKAQGRPHFEVLWKADIDKIRKSSRGKDRGPWSDWYGEMARKSAVRRLCKYLPKTRELAVAIAADGLADAGDYNGYRRALDSDREPDFDAPQPSKKAVGAQAVKDAIGVTEDTELSDCENCGVPVEGQTVCDACARELEL